RVPLRGGPAARPRQARSGRAQRAVARGSARRARSRSRHGRPARRGTRRRRSSHRLTAPMSLEQSPLADVHRALGATMVEFGGWEMPIAYPSGTLDEHLACRRHAVVFDVSHLGTVRVQGPDAFDTLQRTLTNDLAKIAP